MVAVGGDYWDVAPQPVAVALEAVLRLYPERGSDFLGAAGERGGQRQHSAVGSAGVTVGAEALSSPAGRLPRDDCVRAARGGALHSGGKLLEDVAGRTMMPGGDEQRLPWALTSIALRVPSVSAQTVRT